MVDPKVIERTTGRELLVLKRIISALPLLLEVSADAVTDQEEIAMRNELLSSLACICTRVARKSEGIPCRWCGEEDTSGECESCTDVRWPKTEDALATMTGPEMERLLLSYNGSEWYWNPDETEAYVMNVPPNGSAVGRIVNLNDLRDGIRFNAREDDLTDGSKLLAPSWEREGAE